MKSTKLYFYDTPDNKYSVTALLGAMESRSELFEEIDVGFFSRPEELEENESELQRYRRTVLPFPSFPPSSGTSAICSCGSGRCCSAAGA